MIDSFLKIFSFFFSNVIAIAKLSQAVSNLTNVIQTVLVNNSLPRESETILVADPEDRLNQIPDIVSCEWIFLRYEFLLRKC